MAGCSGIDFKPDGSLVRFREEGSTCLLKTRERCRYFEEAILPMRTRKEWPSEGVRKEFQLGAALYDREYVAKIAQRKRRKCLHCGKRIWSKRQYCARCVHQMATV